LGVFSFAQLAPKKRTSALVTPETEGSTEMSSKSFALLSGAILFLGTIVDAQRLQDRTGEPAAGNFSGQRSSEVSGLRLLQLSGVLGTPTGQPLAGVAGVTFAIYKDREGGAPLWLETQNVELNAQGNYSVLLGSTTGEGVPLDIFSSNEPRWLGVRAQVPGSEEQPRLLLVSVPYALKAADADTLGGKPVSAFVLADSAGDKGGSAASSDAQEPRAILPSSRIARI
jgi:hypothetical protein